MIHTIRTVAVGDQESKIDSPIILYRGDREVEVEFTINGSKFTFTNGGNVIKSTNATHGQLVINTPTGENMFSEVTECHDGKVVFVITKEMIDELIEVGFYSFQIRLFDESQVSRVTIPPVLKGIDIRNPIAAEDETNVVDIGLVDYAVVVKDEFEDLSTFLPDGNYNKTEWESKDVISGAKLNKIEDALYSINSNIEATDLALLNRVENINKNVYGEIEKLGGELESEVEEFERRLNNNVELFKINTNAVITAHKNEVSEELDSVNSQIDTLLSKTDFVYPEMFGAIGDGATDDTEAFNQMFNTNKIIRFIKDATYRVGNISIPSNTDIKSDYNTTLSIFQNVTSNPVLLGVGNNCKIENIKFICTVESLEWNRCDMVNRENIILKNCLFEGFRHISDSPNAWGIYLENSKNIEIKNCEFNDNTQSDIAILDGCENIIIDNCKGDAFHINFEPNGSATLKNVNISNCNIDRLNTLENSYVMVTIEDVIISNCIINSYHHRGGNVTLHNTKINNIYSNGDRYCGKFNESSSLILGRNLLSDSKIVDLANSGPNDTHCWYAGYIPNTTTILRGIDEFGEYLSFNPDKINTLVQISTRIPVVPNETYCLKLTASSIYSADSNWIANHGGISILNAEGTSVYSEKIILNQGAIGTTVMPSEKTTFINVPENGVELVMTLRNTNPIATSTTEFKVYNVRLSRVLREPGMIPHDDDKIYVKNKPAAINAGGTNNVFLAGQKVYMKEPVAGGYLGYVCTASGNPGTWKGFGLIES